MSNKLYIFCGIPFSGKSTLAKELAKRTGFTRIDLDEVKFGMFGKDITDFELQQKDWDVIYQEMYRQIKVALSSGQTVILDTGNFTKHERGLVRQIADMSSPQNSKHQVSDPRYHLLNPHEWYSQLSPQFAARLLGGASR